MDTLDKEKSKFFIRNKLKQLIGKEITIYIDRPIGSVHPSHKDIIYEVNYGYIKEIISMDNEYQDAYLIGINEIVQEYKGKVIGIIERENDIEDKLVICPIDKDYNIEEIKKFVNFQEKYFIINIYK